MSDFQTPELSEHLAKRFAEKLRAMTEKRYGHTLYVSAYKKYQTTLYSIRLNEMTNRVNDIEASMLPRVISALILSGVRPEINLPQSHWFENCPGWLSHRSGRKIPGLSSHYEILSSGEEVR